MNNPKEILNTGDDAFQQGIYDFFPGLVYVYDLGEKQLRYINKKITDSLGYSYDDLKEWKQDLSKLIFKDDVDLVQKELEKFKDLKEDESHGYRCRLNRRDGDYIHFQVTGRVLRRNAQGKPESVLFIAQDINEQIRASDEARAFKELMDDTENLLQFATWSWDKSTGREQWSKGVHSLLNYNPNEAEPKITTKFFLDHVLPEDRKRIDELYFEAIRKKLEFLTYEYMIETHDQEIKIFHSSIKFRYADGELIGALGINRDVTEKSTLLNSLLGYREMILEKEKFLGQGTWEMDLVAGTTVWSNGMYALYGYRDDTNPEVIKVDLYHKHMVEERNKIMQRDLIENESAYVWQHSITTNQGETKQLETFGKVFRDAKGEAVKVIGTTRDVTQMLKYERELERRIAELRRSNKDLEDFAYIASHDMHEPLRKVHSFADRMKTKYGDQMEEEAKGYLDRILAATQNARLMIDGLMEFSRLSRNGDMFEKVKLDDVAGEVLSDLELKIEENDVKIDLKPLPEIDGIRTQMKQLFSNIILNSIKFRKGNVAPAILIDSRRLSRQEATDFSLDSDAVYYRVTVTDNGIGFEEEYEETIFQMFQRLNSKSEYPGSGIGLALCKKITENHHGIIKANSQLGKGTVISIILPEIHKK